MITINDYNVLKSIISKEDKEKGMIPTKGTTKREIMDKTGLSITKINISIYSFLKDGLIEEPLKIKNSKTYCITDKGLQKLLKLKGVELK